MFLKMYCFGFLIVILCFVRNLEGAIDVLNTNRLGEETVIINKNINVSKETERSGKSLHKECNGVSFSPKCLKIRALSVIEDLSSRDELSLFSGLSIVKENRTSKSLTPEEMATELSRQFPGKPEEKLNRYLLYRLQNYLDGHSLKYKLLDTETTKEAMDVAKGGKEVGRQHGGGGGGIPGFGGGGGGHGGGGGGGSGSSLLAAAALTKGALGAAALGALALLAGKALMTSILALILSAVVGLKGHGGEKSTTYEIITKPEVSHHHSHSHEEHHEHEHGHHRRAYDPMYSYSNYGSYGTMR